MKQCWSAKPRNRPSFKQILIHLDIAAVEVLSSSPEDYFKTQVIIKYNMQSSYNLITIIGGIVKQNPYTVPR